MTGTIVVGLIAFVLAFLLVIYVRKSYPKFEGTIHVTKTSSGKTLYSLELDDHPEKLREKDHISFKVVGTEDVDL